MNKEHFEMLINEELNSILNEVNKNKLLETKEINSDKRIRRTGSIVLMR